MVILVLSDLWVPFPGGAERLMFNLARHLDRCGENVQVLTSYEARQRFDGPPVDFIDIGVDEHHDEGAATIAWAVTRCRPKVILTHHYFAFEFEQELADLAATGTHIVQVVLNGRRLPFVARAVYISNFVRGVLNDDRPEDMTILPPAFDDVRADAHGNAIGFIKPLHHKGVDLVYDIARAMPDRHFVILRGEWQDIETIVDLPNVEYMEPVVDIRDFYERVRLVLMPSLSEDAGTVAQECAVNGIPCISSMVGGLNETNAQGCRVDSRDPGAWEFAITELDNPRRYELCVLDMQEHLGDQIVVLDEFVARVRALAR